MRQTRLPMALKCCNPGCREIAQAGQWFCSDTCYAKVEHSSVPQRIPLTHIDWAAMIVALVATTALGVTAFLA